VSDLVELLASVDPFSQLGSEELAALAERAEIVRLAAGETLFHQGDPGDRAYVVLEGNLEVSAPGPLEPLVLNILGPGDLVGEVSLLRGGARSATVTARTDVELAAIGPDDLRDSVGAGSGALMRTLLDRWEQTQHVVLRGERLAQLGTLAAGVAHELNNPAAAVRRSSEVLVDTIRRIGSAVTDLVEADLGPEAARCLRRLVVEELETAVSDPLARASAERAVSDLLTDLGVDDPWNLASDVLDAGMGVEDVQRLADEVGAERFVSLLELLASIVSARRLAGEIGWAAGHMSQVAQDLSSYSRLGEAPVQDVDVADGLERTISLLEHRLEGIEVVRDFSPDVPTITAAGSELNQVWTNLLANAADATGPGGRITLRTRLEDGVVVVEIEDDGPGIPPEDLDRIFDAFFTTKPPGAGTGLGLAISHRIVTVDHRGDLTVESVPGRTVFRVSLPPGE
jgi:signal transduction histidine kinase